LASSDTIAPELVSHDHSRDVLQTLQKPPEEALGGVGIAPGLNEDVEHNAILIEPRPSGRQSREDEDDLPGQGRGRSIKASGVHQGALPSDRAVDRDLARREAP
jgi:hypothetical protein